MLLKPFVVSILLHPLFQICYAAQKKTSVEKSHDKRSSSNQNSDENQAQSLNFTFVNVTGNCMLYAKQVTFIVYNDTWRYEPQRPGQNGPSSNDKAVDSLVLSNIQEHLDDKSCENYGGKIALKFNGGKMKNGLTLNDLSLTLTFNSSDASHWWYLEQLDVEATGDIIKDTKHLSRSFNRSQIQQFAEGPKKFNYACGQQQPLIFAPDPVEKIVDGKPKMVLPVRYGIAFKNLQIQPFGYNESIARGWYGFTDQVNDCVPFMSIGVWMFLLCAALLLCIVFFGLAMLGSLKTNDRYDDPKGKPLVVNVKE